MYEVVSAVERRILGAWTRCACGRRRSRHSYTTMSQDEMISMKLTGFGKPLEQFREPVPTPTGTQVLLKVISAGLCHSGNVNPRAVPAISATIVP
jgi:hypothetical protein